MVSIPWVMKTVRFPVTGCLEVAHSTGRMRINFHVQTLFSRIEVVQEGKDPLPCCDLCIIHMPAGRLIKHQKSQRCYRNTQMHWRRRDVAIVIQCKGGPFSLAGEDKA